MAKIVYGLNQTLDGYVNHEAFNPDPILLRHFTDHLRGLAGSVYGRRMYELLRNWDEDQAGWGPDEQEFAAAWRAQPKWVVSTTLPAVGPNATLVRADPAALIRQLQATTDGEIEVAGPRLAGPLCAQGLIDEYRIYLHPFVIGRGDPFFTGPRPPLRLLSCDRVGADVLRLAYAPA